MDAGKSKHIGLAQQNEFGHSSVLPHDDDSLCEILSKVAAFILSSFTLIGLLLLLLCVCPCGWLLLLLLWWQLLLLLLLLVVSDSIGSRVCTNNWVDFWMDIQTFLERVCGVWEAWRNNGSQLDVYLGDPSSWVFTSIMGASPGHRYPVWKEWRKWCGADDDDDDYDDDDDDEAHQDKEAKHILLFSFFQSINWVSLLFGFAIAMLQIHGPPTQLESSWPNHFMLGFQFPS